jgi:hypothetical protein
MITGIHKAKSRIDTNLNVKKQNIYPSWQLRNAVGDREATVDVAVSEILTRLIYLRLFSLLLYDFFITLTS